VVELTVVRSESESETHLAEEPEDPELELNLAIENFLHHLEHSPQSEWPEQLHPLLEAIEPHGKVQLCLLSSHNQFLFPMPPELLARFLVQEELLKRKVRLLGLWVTPRYLEALLFSLFRVRR
jgi:hypothetical protein